MSPHESSPRCSTDLGVAAVASSSHKSTNTLLAELYEDLRELARAYVARQAPGQTIQATGLVHEAYLRLAARSGIAWDDRRYFFFAAARAMRDVIIERHRKKANRRRLLAEHQQAEQAAAPETDVDPLALEDAIQRLASERPELAQIVTLKCYLAMTTAQIGEVLERPIRSIERDWRFARVWLRAELGAE